MNQHNGTRLLAIGLDAAEPTLIRRLIEQDEMPALKSLLAEGRWMRVRSPAHIGSGAVWPTFATGQEPLTHGVYGEWCWRPESMSLVRYDGRNLRPFWKTLSDQGVSVGVLDPPFVKTVGIVDGFEIVDWGAHDPLEDRWQAGPAEIADFLTNQVEPHPFSLNRHDNASPDDPKKIEKLASSCLNGVTLRGGLARSLLTNTRPDFALIVFPEIHHGAHHLWHELDTGLHPRSGPNANTTRQSLRGICHEIDQQIAFLIEAAGADCAMMVFSLHGMRTTAGVPVFLQSLLCEKGFARMADWKHQSWSDRAISFMTTVKRHTPSPVKKLYYKLMAQSTTKFLAQPTMLPVYDWNQTRAFSLPTDQHGWIRINLQGRESAGVVTAAEYDPTCRQLEDFLLGLTTKDGRLLVREVTRTATTFEEARSSKLPDVVVHWADAAFDTSSTIDRSAVRIETISRKFTGQHASDGFCILRAQSNLDGNDELPATDMHLLITRLLAEA
jgi:predicted AlkP superfamily phosphohydrolase/phosphomutase